MPPGNQSADRRLTMIISLIAALDRNGLIGKDQSIPWRAPADLAHFKSITMGKPMVMGRRTCESLPQALPGRRNLVLTHNPGFTRDGFEVFHTITDVIKTTQSDEALMVIGGAEIYRLFLPIAQYAYVTIVEGEFNGDTWFPEWPLMGWRQVRTTQRPPDARNAHPLTFTEYEKLEKI
jgi:dihydrofolate reductase